MKRYIKMVFQSSQVLGLGVFSYHKGFFILLGIVMALVSVIFVKGLSILLSSGIIALLLVALFIGSWVAFGFWKTTGRFILGAVLGTVIFIVCLIVTVWHSWIPLLIPWISPLFALLVISGVLGYFLAVFIDWKHVSIHVSAIFFATWVAVSLEATLGMILTGLLGILLGITFEILLQEREEFQKMVRLGFMSRLHKDSIKSSSGSWRKFL
jgi:hypothetical protein